MKKILLTVALIFAFAKYECAQNAAAPQQGQRQRIPNTITIGDVILKFEDNKWYKIQNQANVPLTTEDLYNILRMIPIDDVMKKVNKMFDIQGKGNFNSITKHMFEQGHLGYVPKIKRSNKITRNETFMSRSFFTLPRDIKKEYNQYIKYFDAKNFQTNKFSFPDNITTLYKQLEKKLINFAKTIIDKIGNNKYISKELRHFTRRNNANQPVNESINILLSPDEGVKSTTGIFSSSFTDTQTTSKIRICIAIEENKLKVKTLFPSKNLNDD